MTCKTRDAGWGRSHQLPQASTTLRVKPINFLQEAMRLPSGAQKAQVLVLMAGEPCGQGCHPQGSDSGEGLPKQCLRAQTLGTQAHHREITTCPFGRSCRTRDMRVHTQMWVGVHVCTRIPVWSVCTRVLTHVHVGWCIDIRVHTCGCY